MQKFLFYSNQWLLGVLLLTSMALGCPKTALAKESLRTIRLYTENGKTVSDYNQQIANILEANQQGKLPIIVQFSKGMTVTVYSVGHGNQNLILDIGNNKVLRIRITKYRPLYFWNALVNPSAMVDSMSNFLIGYRVLKENGVPVPELTLIPGRESEFLILEKINIEFLYADYLNPDFVNKIPLEEREKIDKDFLDFVSKTTKFRNFGDFGGKQLAYTKDRGWVLFDFSNNHDLNIGTGGNVFELDMYDELSNKHAQYSSSPQEVIRKPGLPAHLKNKVREIIRIGRSGKPSKSLQCNSLFK